MQGDKQNFFDLSNFEMNDNLFEFQSSMPTFNLGNPILSSANTMITNDSCSFSNYISTQNESNSRVLTNNNNNNLTFPAFFGK